MTDKPGHHTFRAGEDASPEDVPPYFQNHLMLFTAGTDIQRGQLVTPSEKDGKLYPIKWQREQNDRNEAVDLAVKEVATGVSASQVREDLDSTSDRFMEALARAKRKAVIEAQPAIRAYMDERRFDDPDFIRAVIVEFVKLSAAMKLKQVDDEL